jgi:hypothetical protein
MPFCVATPHRGRFLRNLPFALSSMKITPAVSSALRIALRTVRLGTPTSILEVDNGVARDNSGARQLRLIHEGTGGAALQRQDRHEYYGLTDTLTTDIVRMVAE